MIILFMLCLSFVRIELARHQNLFYTYDVDLLG